MKPLWIPPLSPEQLEALEELLYLARDPSGALENTRPEEDGLAGWRAAPYSRHDRRDRPLHSEETVRRWPKRYLAEGVEGLRDIPRLGAPPKADTHIRSGRSRPSAAVGRLLHGETKTGIRVEGEIVRRRLKGRGDSAHSPPEHTI